MRAGAGWWVPAERYEADVGRSVAHQQEHAEKRDRQQRDHETEGGAPAPCLGRRGYHRQEDELSGGVGGGEQADDDAAPAHEPACRHRGGEYRCRHAGTEANDEAPEQHELPEFGHGDGEAEAGNDQNKGDERRPGRTPKRFISAAENGPIKPNSTRRTAKAVDMSEFRQPNSASSGRSMTPGAPSAPAVASMVRNVTAATTQP